MMITGEPGTRYSVETPWSCNGVAVEVKEEFQNSGPRSDCQLLHIIKYQIHFSSSILFSPVPEDHRQGPPPPSRLDEANEVLVMSFLSIGN